MIPVRVQPTIWLGTNQRLSDHKHCKKTGPLHLQPKRVTTYPPRCIPGRYTAVCYSRHSKDSNYEPVSRPLHVHTSIKGRLPPDSSVEFNVNSACERRRPLPPKGDLEGYGSCNEDHRGKFDWKYVLQGSCVRAAVASVAFAGLLVFSRPAVAGHLVPPPVAMNVATFADASSSSSSAPPTMTPPSLDAPASSSSSVSGGESPTAPSPAVVPTPISTPSENPSPGSPPSAAPSAPADTPPPAPTDKSGSGYTGLFNFPGLKLDITQVDESSAESNLQVLEEAWQVVDENYLSSRGREFDRAMWRAKLEEARASPPATRAAAYSTLRGMLGSLKDPYTRFLAPAEFLKFSKYDITGVGLNISEDPDSISGIKIMGLVLDSPSAKAGIRQGDELLVVDGYPVSGLSAFQAASRIQGPQGTSVTMKVRHSDGVTEEVAVQRGASGVSSPVTARVDADRTGYIKLSEFNAVAGRDVAAAVTSLQAQGATRFVLDLRDNPGGLVQAGIEIARLFLDPDRVVVYTARRAAPTNTAEVKRTSVRADRKPITKAPLTVLVNGRSASASEILAAALQDNCRATLVGGKTYGKGLIQSVYELSDQSGLVLTVGRYVTPGLTDIDQRGINPDFGSMPSTAAAYDQIAACALPAKVSAQAPEPPASAGAPSEPAQQPPVAT